MFPDVVTVHIQRWSSWSTYILINVLCLYLHETYADHINASCLHGDITSKPSILGLLQVVFTLTLQPKIVTSSLESLLDESRCVHLHNLIQTSTTSCKDPTGICMNICVVVKDCIICYKALCAQLAYAHKVDQIINKLLYRFSPTFFYILMCRQHVKTVTTIWMSRTPIISALFKHHMLLCWAPPCSVTVRVSKQVGLNVRQKKKQENHKGVEQNVTFFHEHQSLRTSSFIHVSPSIRILRITFICTHTYAVTSAKVLGQWFHLGLVRATTGYVFIIF